MSGRTRTRRVRTVPRVEPPGPVRFPAMRALDAGRLPVLLAGRHAMPILDLHLVFRHGATADPPSLAGCASLTASTLDTGTRTASQAEIARRLEALGTALAVQTAWDHSSIGVRVLSDHLRPALRLLGELVREAAFPDAEFEQRKQLCVESILQEENEPEIVAGNAIARAIFGDRHPYGRPSSGTRESVGALKRDDIVDFHNRNFHPANAFLVAVGDVDPAILMVAAGEAFGDWASPPGLELGTVPEPGPVVPHIRLVDRPGARQSEIRIGAVGAERTSSNYFALLVLNTMLGGSFTSRLNAKLREERGCTYGAFSRFAFRRSRGPFVAGASVDTEATDLAIADSLDVFHSMEIEVADEAEIERARRYLSLGLVHGLETNAGVAARMAEVEVHGLGEDYYEGYVGRIGAVTAERVREMAGRYLRRSGLAFVVVGDGSSTRGRLEALGLGPVVEERAAP